MHTHTHLKQNVEESKHPRLLNYKEDTHTLFLISTMEISKHARRQRAWHINLHVLIHLIPPFAHLTSSSPSLFFSGWKSWKQNPYVFLQKHPAVTTFNTNNHNSLNIVRHPAPSHISLKVSTVSFLWLVCLNEDPHPIRTLHWVGGVDLRSPLDTWNGTSRGGRIWRRNKWAGECKWHKVP